MLIENRIVGVVTTKNLIGDRPYTVTLFTPEYEQLGLLLETCGKSHILPVEGGTVSHEQGREIARALSDLLADIPDAEDSSVMGFWSSRKGILKSLAATFGADECKVYGTDRKTDPDSIIAY